MPVAYDTLKIEHNRCPPDCWRCEEACTREKGLSRIKVVHASPVKFNGAITCNQCNQPRCVPICPAGAIEKSRTDGVVRLDESRCVGCGLCTLACSYGGIYYDTQTHRAFKCDKCEGKPKCVEACPYQVLTYVRNNPVLSYLLEEDVVSPGSPACPGCLAELALRFTLRILGKNTILFMAPGCAVTFVIGFGTKAQVRLAENPCLLTNVAATMTGAYRYYKSIGRDDIHFVSFVGDGATVDAGFHALSGAAERGERLIYICNDNEGYMNTGVQRSGSTPFKAQTATTPAGKVRKGKEQNSKYLPLIMLFHGVPYVATATIAYPEDYARKLTKAMNIKEGLSYLHLFLPCTTGWGVREDEGLDICQLGVETNYFPLWEAEQGRVRLTQEVANPKPMHEYLERIGKYSHLTGEDIAQIQELVNARYNTIQSLAASNIACRV